MSQTRQIGKAIAVGVMIGAGVLAFIGVVTAVQDHRFTRRTVDAYELIAQNYREAEQLMELADDVVEKAAVGQAQEVFLARAARLYLNMNDRTRERIRPELSEILEGHASADIELGFGPDYEQTVLAQYARVRAELLRRHSKERGRKATSAPDFFIPTSDVKSERRE